MHAQKLGLLVLSGRIRLVDLGVLEWFPRLLLRVLQWRLPPGDHRFTFRNVVGRFRLDRHEKLLLVDATRFSHLQISCAIGAFTFQTD